MSRPQDGYDLGQVGADDIWITDMGAGTDAGPTSKPDQDHVFALLGAWRQELDEVALAAPRSTVDTCDMVASGTRQFRHKRTNRRTAAVAALGVSVAMAMTGTAAAVTGAHGPLGSLHRALFGSQGPVQAADLLAVRAGALLNQAAGDIAARQRLGGISAEQRARIVKALDDAESLLRRDPHASTSLVKRANSLRADLNALPALPALPLTPTAELRPARVAPSPSVIVIPSGADQSPTSSVRAPGGPPTGAAHAVAPRPVATPEAGGTGEAGSTGPTGGTDANGNSGDNSRPSDRNPRPEDSGKPAPSEASGSTTDSTRDGKTGPSESRPTDVTQQVDGNTPGDGSSAGD